MTAYMQQMSGAGIADRIALIAHEVRFCNLLCEHPLYTDSSSAW